MQTPAENKRGIKNEALTEFLPTSNEKVRYVLDIADQYTKKEIEQDPAKGRKMHAELQQRVNQVKDEIIQEIVDRYFYLPYPSAIIATTNQPHDPLEKMRDYKEMLFTSFGRFNYHYNPHESVDETDKLTSLIKDYFIRTIRLGVIVKLKNDSRFTEALNQRIINWSETLKKRLRVRPESEADQVADVYNFEINRIASEEYAILWDYGYIRRGEGINVIKLDNKDEAFLKETNAALAKEITEKRDYALEPVYTFDYELGSPQEPFVIAFADPSADFFHTYESMATAMLISDKKLWDDKCAENAHLLEDLSKGETYLKQIKAAVRKTMKGSGEPEDQQNLNATLEQTLPKTGLSFVIGSFPVGIRWTDGELVIPNSDILFKELLPEEEQGWYELLRFSILSKLRALLVRERKDVSPEIIGKLKKRKKGSTKITNTSLEEKIFPRVTRTKNTDAMQPILAENTEEADRKPDLEPRKIIGYRKKLPKGHFASPEAVALAKRNGIELASVIGKDGITRFTETFVRDHEWPRKRPGEPEIQRLNREGKFKDERK